MSINKPPKNIRRQIKELSIQAYEIELRIHLGELHKKFDEWKNNQLKSGELSDLIHEFHHGPSREMYTYYNTVDPELAVGRAVALDFFSLEKIPEDVYPFISRCIDFYKDQ